MSESGGLLSNHDHSSTSRSYGALHNNTMTNICVDMKLFSHKLQPTDTLHGLAIKYGVSVERLKRINKLWSNDTIHIKDSLLIPCSNDLPHKSVLEHSANSDFLLNSAPDKINKVGTSKDSSEISTESSVENSADISSTTTDSSCNGEVTETYDSIFSKIDEQIKVYKDSVQQQLGDSDTYKSFNDMLVKIDGQIEEHKLKHESMLPTVSYDAGHHHVTFHDAYKSPKKCPLQEHGI